MSVTRRDIPEITIQILFNKHSSTINPFQNSNYYYDFINNPPKIRKRYIPQISNIYLFLTQLGIKECSLDSSQETLHYTIFKMAITAFVQSTRRKKKYTKLRFQNRQQKCSSRKKLVLATMACDQLTDFVEPNLMEICLDFGIWKLFPMAL